MGEGWGEVEKIKHLPLSPALSLRGRGS